MARRSRRELEIADHLWDCLTRIAEDCGTDRNAVANQAIYELARRFNFLTPMAKAAPQPEDQVSPYMSAGGPLATSENLGASKDPMRTLDPHRVPASQSPLIPAAQQSINPTSHQAPGIAARRPAPQAPAMPPGQGFAPRVPPSPTAVPAAQIAPQKKTLYVINGGGDMTKIDKDTFIIGRSRTCDLVIPSSKVSRQHSNVCKENGEYYIEDLGSANGVWKDGVKIQKEKISDGDEFMISEEVLRFVYR